MYRYIKSAIGLLLAAMMLASCGDKRSQLQPIESPKPNTQTVVQDPTKPPEENPSIPSNPTPEKPTPENPTEPVGPIDPIDPDVPENDLEVMNFADVDTPTWTEYGTFGFSSKSEEYRDAGAE